MEHRASLESCITLAKGQKAFAEGDHCKGFPIVLSGVIAVRKLYASGRSIALYRIAPGDSCLLSLSALLGDSDVYNADAVAMEESRIMMLSASAFDARLVADAPFRRQVLANFSSRLLSLTALVEAMVEQGVDQRLATLLLTRGPVIETTHSELASDLGTVREIVSRILLRFQRADWLALGRGRIDIRDGGALQRFAQGDV